MRPKYLTISLAAALLLVLAAGCATDLPEVDRGEPALEASTNVAPARDVARKGAASDTRAGNIEGGKHR